MMPFSLPTSSYFFLFLLIFLMQCSCSPLSFTLHNMTYLSPRSYSYKLLTHEASDQSLRMTLLQLSRSEDKTYYTDERNTISEHLAVEIRIRGDKYVSLKIWDESKEDKTYEIPEEDPFPRDTPYLTSRIGGDSGNLSNSLLEFHVTEEPFSIEIKRRATNETLFTTSDFDMILSGKYLQLSTILPTREIFGIGERNHQFKLQVPGLYTLWNKDLFAELDHGQGGKNAYGSHPMYLMREASNKFHCVSLRNSFGMDIELSMIEKITEFGVIDLPKLTYKLTGGVLDLRFFIGESAEDAILLYHSYVGGHLLPPFWAFGYHQSRYGYHNWAAVKELIQKFNRYRIPLDVIWFDIDYMKDYRAFTIDSDRFDPETMNNDLSELEKRLVVILDPGIAISHGDRAYEEGIRRGIFMKKPNGDYVEGCVWPGRTYYPDFMHPEAEKFWADMIEELYEKLKFSGLWIDMNEFASLINGGVNQHFPEQECGLNKHDNVYSIEDKCAYSDDDYFVYIPGNLWPEINGICLNSRHANNLTEFEVHNFNGLLMSKATNSALRNRLHFEQPFILTRSTAPGSGKYAIHWTGDNKSGWEWLRISIAGVFNFNLFGIPFVGADICGFAGEADEELCSRWMQLGAVYPFFRNHNFMASPDQDPFSFDETMIEASRASIHFRYTIMKYLYSLFVRTKGLGTVIRPLFFEYPHEDECYSSDVLEQEILISTDLLATPVVHPQEHQIHPYFPGKSNWFSLHSGEAYPGGSHHMISCGMTDIVPVFLRAGAVIYRQDVNDTVLNSKGLDNRFVLSIGLARGDNGVYSESSGLIMAVNDYMNVSKLNICSGSGCFLIIRATYKEFSGDSKGKSQILIVFEPQEGLDVKVIDRIGIIGLDLYGLEVKENVRDVEAAALRICGHKGKDLAMEEVGVKGEWADHVLELRFMKVMNVEASDQILLEINQ